MTKIKVMTKTKTREACARRKLSQNGFALVKSRKQSRGWVEQPYLVFEKHSNGSHQNYQTFLWRFIVQDLFNGDIPCGSTLEEVEEWIVENFS